MTTDPVTVSWLRRLMTLALCGGVWVAIQINPARAASIPPPPPAKPGVEIVDDFRYETAEAAQEAWRASEKRDDQGARVATESTAPAEPVVIDGRPALKLTCNFEGTTIPRGVWDGHVSLDLSLASAISFDVYAQNLQAIGYAHLYIRSGPGWYGCEWYPAAEGKWCHIRLRKSHFSVDKPGAGWAQIEGIRFSPWAMRREDAVLYVANLGVEKAQAPVLILRQEYDDPAKRGEQKSATRFTQSVADLLGDAGVSLPVVNTPDLTPEMLGDTRVVVMPYASGMQDDTVKLLADFIDAGGKVIACFSVPASIAQRLGVSLEGWRGGQFPGEFSSMRFVEGVLPDAPRIVGQKSWGIVHAEAVDGRAGVAAWWHSEDGEQTDAPAVILSGRGAHFSHVILDDDPVPKRAMLKELVAQFCPAVREQACDARIASLGASLGASDWAAALLLVAAQPSFSDRAAEALNRAKERYVDAQAKRAAGSFNEACELAEQADAQLLEAYCLSQRSQWPEFRATWCHPVVGVPGWSWDRTASVLKTNGIDHLILNALHGASAGYPSEVLPTDVSLPAGSDAFAECIRACRKHDIKLHVWMTNYQPHGHAPKEFVDRLRTEGRLQVDVNGDPAEQLCPSDDRNVALQREAMVEAAKIDGVAGIHFDYIRYPDGNKCYCATCRSKFEQRIGRKLERWPQDVLGDRALHEQWLQFRCDNITRLVREVHDEVRRVAPECMISAAVFKNFPRCRDEVGQDWRLWIDRGYLDFVCPMDYTGSDAEFESLVISQLEIVGERIPCYPGIGLLEHRGPADAIRQIEITRRLNTGGFVIWSVYPRYIDTYPCLGMGALGR